MARRTITNEAMANTEAQVGDRLIELGVRFTKGRRAVVRALATADGPRSAAELHHETMRDVPLSSLYRSLAVLESAGIVDTHHGHRGLARYELAEWLKGHHHHLVCVDCGAVEDIELPVGLEGDLESLISRVTEISMFRALGHKLEVDGRCARCA